MFIEVCEGTTFHSCLLESILLIGNMFRLLLLSRLSSVLFGWARGSMVYVGPCVV